MSRMKSFSIAMLILSIIQNHDSHGQEEHFAESEGVNIHFTTFGEGPPILIINGGPGFSSEGFVPIATEISEGGYQTILYDQRGTGQSAMSETDSTNITMDLMVRDIEAIRKDLYIDEWIVLGHSFGGMMANYYAAKHPSKVKAIISSSSGGIDLALLGNAQADLFSKLTQTEIDSMRHWRGQMQTGDNPEYARRKFARYMAPAYVYNKEFIPVVAERLTQGNLSLNRLVWDDMIRIDFDCKEELSSFSKPVLIIQGKEDVITEDLAKQADSVFQNSKIVLLDSCSHYGWLDQPDKYFNSIFAFLKDVEQFSEDENQVRLVLENYIKSIYDADSTLVETIADSSLQKSGHYYSHQRKRWSYENMDFAGLQHTAATYNKKGLLPDWAPAEIEIFEVKEKVASAKIKAIWGFDYVLLSKQDGQWIMDKVLWQSYSPEEREEYFKKLRSIEEETSGKVE